MCAGTLEVKHLGEWRPVTFFDWTLKEAAVVYEHLNCGSAVTFGWKPQRPAPLWKIKLDCVWSGSTLRECATPDNSYIALILTCLGELISDIIYVIVFDINSTV